MTNLMSKVRAGLAGLALSTLSLVSVGARPAAAAVVIVHDGPREAPPPEIREQRARERRGYVWDGGHYEWRHRRYVWSRGHYVRERRGYEWAPGRWERHEDHYDWHRGEWHPHR
jgi:YXWGXW repeat-containing protein